MNNSWMRSGAIAAGLILLCGCSATNKAQTDAQGDLYSAYRQAQIGNTASARQWVDLAIKADPNDINVYAEDGDLDSQSDYTVRRVFETVGDSPSEILYMRKAALLFPKEYLPLEDLMANDDLVGDKAGMQADATALVKLLQTKVLLPANSSDLEGLTLLLADAYCQAGNPAAGYQKFHNLIATYPSDWEPYNWAAYDYAVLNDKPHLQEALIDANKAMSLANGVTTDYKDQDVAAAQDTLAWVQYRLGDYADAAQNSELAVIGIPTEADARYHLAMIYIAEGKPDAAKVELQRAITLNPSYADAIAANNQLQAPPPPAAGPKTAMAVGAKSPAEVP